MTLVAEEPATWWMGLVVGVAGPVAAGAVLIWNSVSDTRRKGRIDALAEWKDLHALDNDRIQTLEKQLTVQSAGYEQRLAEVSADAEKRVAAAEARAATLHDRNIILEQQDVERRHENANLKQVINGLRLKLGVDPIPPFPNTKGDPLGPPDSDDNLTAGS